MKRALRRHGWLVDAPALRAVLVAILTLLPSLQLANIPAAPSPADQERAAAVALYGDGFFCGDMSGETRHEGCPQCCLDCCSGPTTSAVVNPARALFVVLPRSVERAPPFDATPLRPFARYESDIAVRGPPERS